jgi:hypothetical protein
MITGAMQASGVAMGGEFSGYIARSRMNGAGRTFVSCA